MVRAFLGVILGYAVFTGSSALLFRMSRPSAILAVVCGVVFAGIAGLAAALIGGEKGHAASFTLGVAIAIGAVISIFARPGTGALSAQLAALFLMAPAAVAGGHVLPRRRSPHL